MRFRLPAVPVLFMLLLSACNLSAPQALPTPNNDNVIYVTATMPLPTANAEGVVVITATPDTGVSAPLVTATQAEVVSVQQTTPLTQPTALLPASATPQPSPAPTIQPDAELAQARNLQRNGYYEEAMQIYEKIMLRGDAIAPEARAEAAFRAGQAALREGLFSQAVDSLSLLISQFPASEHTPQAYFLRGDAYLGLGEWAQALGDFQQYLGLRPGLVDSYAYERIADAQLALSQLDTALVNYEQSLAASRSLVPQLILREKVAEILINAGRVDEAVAQYDAILEVAQNAPYRAAIELSAARALINAGNPVDGLPRLRRIFDSYSSTASAYPAMQLLLENNIELDAFQRGQVAYNYGDYNTAIDAFNEVSSTSTLDEIPAELYLLLGRAYREVGNSQAAILAFQTIIEQYPADPLFGGALLEQGRTRFLDGDIPNAIQTYLGIASNYGYLADTAAEALWRAGYLYGTRDEPALSRQTFVRLADEYPADEWAVNGLFLAASAAVKAGNPETAESLYARIASIATGEDQAAAYLWAGKLALDRGDSATAEAAFTQAIQAAPESYFAVRAADIRAGRPPFQPPATYRFEMDETAERAIAEDWMRTTFNLTQTENLSALSTSLKADPRLVRGSELWQLAAYSEAISEFGALMDEMRETQNILAAYQLAIYFKDMGAYYSSVIAAADVIRAAGVSTTDAPPYIARMRYPAHYLDVVQPTSESYDFDPLLLFSLIRHESLFNAFATAAASEKGLTQVIPSTAQYIAEQLDWENYQHGVLFRPYASVSFGAFYLDEQLERFDNSVIPALAAYNAGPGRALDWQALSGGDPDLFMTTITIDSTRLYIQRIYSYHTVYRALYGTS